MTRPASVPIFAEVVVMGETVIEEWIGDAHSRRRARRALRPRRRPATLLAAVLVTAIGGLAMAALLLDVPPRADAFLRRTAWDDPAVLAAAAGLALTGLLLVLASLPLRPRTLALHTTDPRLAASVRRSHARAALVAAARNVPGITRARVRLRRRVTVRAATLYRNPANLPDMVRTAVTVRLAALGLARERRVRVRLTWRKD
ncbi:DUF6286 domain-containing protein [Spirillospora sp. CA-294931]|uniref:DUF6286 domain-containing protein n=1 Tax=Spirillospora sp. CA-294931 TaxID=3240042 RepID=UPI003D94A5BE